MRKMKRIVSLLCVIMLIFSLTACGGNEDPNNNGDAGSEDVTYELKFGHIYAPGHPYSNAADKIAELVTERSEGKVNVVIYGAGQLGSEKDLADGIVAGTVDVAYVGPGELGKRFAPISVFDAPFIFDGPEHGNKVVNGEIGQRLYQQMSDEIGITALGSMYYGTRYVTTKDFPVSSPADLEGKKLRAPDMPLPTAVVRGMGAQPTPMAFAEVYLALQQGVVDGQENPIPTIYTNKFYEVQDYISLTGHTVAFTPVIMSNEKFDSIPEEYQQIIKDAVQEVIPMEIEETLTFEIEKLEEMKNNGMNVIEPDKAAFIEAAKEIVAEFEEQWGAGLYEEIRNAN